MIKRKAIDVASINATEKEVSAINVDDAHEVLGHISRPMTASIARHLGWTVSGKPSICEGCAVGKAQQQNVNKKSMHVIAKDAGDQLFINIASI